MIPVSSPLGHVGSPISNNQLPPYVFPDLPAQGTPEFIAQREAADRHSLALGKFIGMFAGVEAQLFALLGGLSGLPIEMARALFGDARIDTLTSRIKKVFEARKQMNRPVEAGIEALLNETIDRVSLINGTRNHLVHHMTFYPGSDEPVVSNVARALHKEAIREMTITPDEIMRMVDDLGTASIIIGIVAAKLGQPWRPVPNELQEVIDKRAWRHTPPSQGGKSRKTQKTPQGPQPQP